MDKKTASQYSSLAITSDYAKCFLSWTSVKLFNFLQYSDSTIATFAYSFNMLVPLEISVSLATSN